ncbi:MAG: hypothetical protein KUF80_06160 [Candidatus Thiodiazotropha sp. (ex Codakia orbicularis)]|nr:hypothetical protein [Candidatus Thiodiazotropha sp. (ex Codakia orbicularis)]
MTQSKKNLIGILSLLLLLFVLAGSILFSPYRAHTVAVYLDPWDDHSASDIQLMHELVAIGKSAIAVEANNHRLR